jgi:hypothetical protein
MAVGQDVADLVLQLVFAAWINELVLLAARPLPNDSLLQRLHSPSKISMRCLLPARCSGATQASSNNRLNSYGKRFIKLNAHC